MRLVLTALFMFLLAPAAMSLTPAGSRLSNEPSLYLNGETRTSESISVTIPQIYGLRIRPPEIDARVPPGRASYFPCVLENLGNGTDRVLLEANHPPTDFLIRIVADENADGVRQDFEARELPDSLVLAEGGAIKFFVEITPPANAKSGQWLFVNLSAYSSITDGAAYTGFNGLRYGGSDRVTMRISAIVQ